MAEINSCSYRAVKEEGRPGSSEPQCFLENGRCVDQLGELLARGYHAVAVKFQHDFYLKDATHALFRKRCS